MCSDAPDTSLQQAAAMKSADLSEDQLNFLKGIYTDTAPDRAAATQRANDVSDAQLAQMKQATAQSADQTAYQKSTFQPLEQKMAQDALAYDTPAREEQAAGNAQAGVTQQLSLADAANTRSLARAGVNPSDGAAQFARTSMGLGGALGKAQAANTARLNTQTIGAAKLADAVNLGRGIASSQATQAGVALNAGNASAGNAVTGLNAATSGAGLVSNGYQGATSGLNTAAGIYGNIANTNASTSNANAQATGSLAGAAMTALALSDKTKKKNIKPVASGKSLADLRKLDVKEWDYKDGEGDGGRHVGPMAQDTRTALGDAVAPGGKAIDLISMNGKTVSALQHLDKTVQEVHKRVTSLEHARRPAKRAA